MSGRLFGIQAEEKSTLDFWRFSQYWDPAEKNAVIVQYDWNVVDIGHLSTEVIDDVETIKMNQTFSHYADGECRERHTGTKPDPDTHKTISWSIDDEDNWTKIELISSRY